MRLFEQNLNNNREKVTKITVSKSCQLLDVQKALACVAGAKRGGRGGGRKAPSPLPFSLFPYPLPLSTPATQAKKALIENNWLDFCIN